MIKDLIIEHADIFGPCSNRNGSVRGWRNFSGRGFKGQGTSMPSFHVKITDKDLAERLFREGWKIKQLTPRDPDAEPEYSLEVKVNFGVRPPLIEQCANKRKVVLNETTIKTLDFAQIEDCYIAVHPRVWEDDGEQRVTAYLTDMLVKLRDTPFADLYPDYEDGDVPM